MKKKILLIDAIPTSSGGAINHLKILLENFNKQSFFDKVEVHLPYKTMKLLPKNKKINYVNFKSLEKYFFLRIIWQVVFLNIRIKMKKFDCVFVTGGSHFLFHDKIVNISQNLLPFSKREVKKYFISLFYFKLKLLKLIQSYSFRSSKGLIFLHKYSKKIILKQVGQSDTTYKIIPHCVEKFLPNLKKIKLPTYSKFRFIYVSNIDHYKNQDFIINAMNEIFKKFPYLKKKIFFEFYGSAYKPALIKIENLIKTNNENRLNFKYYGIKNKKYIYRIRKGYNTISLFASSCENFSVALLESLFLNLPILCVNLQPMKSVLGKHAEYYNYQSKKNFKKKIINMISNFEMLKKRAEKKKFLTKNYTISSFVFNTYSFLNQISDEK